MPKANWLFAHEKEAIVENVKKNPGEGYRRLAYRMIDDDMVYATPSSVYRVLRAAGLLCKYMPAKNNAKGMGYTQPDGSHREWHIDISYVNIQGTFLFLVALTEEYSRYVVHHELRAAMEEKDGELVVQRALERFPDHKQRIISDRGSQFIAKDFKEFIR